MILTSIVVGCMPFHNLKHDYNKLESSFYLALSRPAWSFAIFWMIFNCVHGMAEPVNSFLGHPVFKVIAKLSYGMYLTHIAVEYSRNGAEKVTYHFSNFDMVIFYHFFLRFP